MALTLTGILKIKERERLARDGSLRGAAQMYAASLREKEEQKKKDEYQRQQQLIQDKYMEGIRARERQALEDERNTKRYFQVDKYGRKIPAPDEPVFFGQMIEKSQAWLPHGPGQFSINGEVVMKGEFKNGDFTQGTVHWGDGSVWEGGLVDHKMNGVGFVTDPLGERKEAMMRRSVLVCYKDGKCHSICRRCCCFASHNYILLYCRVTQRQANRVWRASVRCLSTPKPQAHCYYYTQHTGLVV